MIRIAEARRVERFVERETGLFTCVNPREHVEPISSSALFLGLSSQECRDICSFARVKTYFRNEILFRQGEPVCKLVWIQTGRVKLTHVSADGHEVLLWVKGTGEAADLHGNQPECRHSCSARVMERCQALAWDWSSFRALAARYPQINANIATIMAARLHELEERFCEIATKDVADRLALALLRLADSVGIRRPSGLEVDLSRQELAELTGTTQHTVSRTLSSWAHAGLIVTRRGSVVIPDSQGLRDFRHPERGGLSLCRWTRDRSAQRGSYSPSATEA